MKPQSLIKDIGEIIFFSTVILVMCFIFTWPFEIEGASMENNFFNGDRVMISRFFVFINQLKIGDVVVFKREQDEVHMIKRIIGLPGDQIVIRDGMIFINGIILEENYIGPLSETGGEYEVILNDDEFFVLGDNRSLSYDSRSYGPINKKEFTGKVIFKWYPLLHA